MKNRKYFIRKAVGLSLIAALALSQGCKKSFLDVQTSNTKTSQQFWQNQQDATDAVGAMYANLHGWTNVSFAPIAIESMGSGDVDKGSSANDASFMNDFKSFTATAGEGQISDFWQGQYENINYANQILGNVPNISMDANLKARYLAEAKFVRAYSYFRLLRAFGNIPLVLKAPVTPQELNPKQAPAAAVWAAIEADLNDAAAGLPATYGSADIGHATKGAALALHAKVALYQNKWSDVKTYTEQVTTLGIYSLFPDFEKMFRTQNKNNSESIFELQMILIPGNAAASNSQYSQVQGVRGSTGGGWGFNNPSQDLINEFEANDPRLAATVITRGTTTPEGDAIPATGDDTYFNMKSYVPFSLYVSGFNEGCQQDKIVLRYADVLLMNAEANNELGNSAAALASLEMVRARAREGNASILPKVTTTDQGTLRTAIYHERRVELAMEFERFFDVIRQGRAGTVFASRGFVVGKNEHWPIPQTQIDLSGGNLVQNKGY
ncbi:MAG: RagB/SusD family nutrient uptake outer membrane protein [Sphingobacteriales bacterium]